MTKTATARSEAGVSPPTAKNYVVFDIEATGLAPWYGDRVTCICARDSEGRAFQEVGENELKIAHAFLEWLRMRDPRDTVLVTKNGRQFDVPFLLTRLALAGGQWREKGLFLLEYEHFDLQDLTEKWVTLSDLARLLKCSPKSGSGLQAIRFWKKRDFLKLKSYCMQDVVTTEEVYLKWLTLGA